MENTHNISAHAIVSRMTLDEKIGATLTVLAKGSVFLPILEDVIMTHHIGGLRVVPTDRMPEPTLTCMPEDGGIYLLAGKGAASKRFRLDELRHLYKKLQDMAVTRNSGIPLHISFDQEGEFSGDLKNGGTPVFPPPMGIAASGDPSLAYDVAMALSRIARATCVNMIHSPALDVNTDPRNPEINTRAYSDRAETVVEYALESARGFKEGGLIATAKHFPGRGQSAVDAHHEIPIIDKDYDALWNVDLLPYRALIEQGLLPAIMTTHTIYPAVDPDNVATLSKKWLQDMLREKLQFEGVITSDAIGMGAITLRDSVPVGTAKALAAGADMVLVRLANKDPMMPLVPQVIAEVKRFVETGLLPEVELDRKVERIIKMKMDVGLFENHGWAEAVDDVVKEKHVLEVSDRASAKTVFVVRQNEGALPLQRDQKALVIEQTFVDFLCPNDDNWMPGMLYNAMLPYSGKLSYAEIGTANLSDEDTEKLVELASGYETVVVTNWTRRSAGSTNALVRKLESIVKGTVILVANTPYEAFSVPTEAQNVIVHFGLTPRSVEIVADVLFGATPPQGQWPLDYRP